MDSFIAHKKIVDDDTEVQTVIEHCTNVAGKAAGYAVNIGTASLAELLGLIHDLGKLNADFREYILGNNDIKRGEIDHSYAGAKYLMQIAEKTGDKKLIETAAFVSRIVVSHHGLHDWIDENGNDYFVRRISSEDRFIEIKDNIKKHMSDEEILKLLERASIEYGVVRKKLVQLCSDRDKVKLAFYFGQFERLMLSVLIDADRTDTTDFMRGEDTEFSYDSDIDSDIWAEFCNHIESLSESYRKQTDRISKLRSDISDRCNAFADHEIGICRLVVPTGGGKTLSSLRFAVNYCRKYRKERIFYIAPFMSILEQNSGVFKQVLGDEYVIEHHSDMFSRIQDENELEEYELRSDKWDMPVIATTLVQFMNTLFKDRMDSVRRMHRLCNSVIIIDEVQSVPAKCVSMFNLAMNFISKIGGAGIILCSATQPAFEKTKYPLNLDEKVSMTGDYFKDFEEFRRNSIISMVRQAGYSYKEAADFCIEKCSDEGSVLFITNTKKSASELFRLLSECQQTDITVLHLSTNMCPEHRRDIIQKTRDMLRQKKRIICVTTQLIEAGVDVSFPCVIRSLAGFDNAAQAAGRCNRNGEIDRCCNVYLLNLQEERLGNLKDIKIARDISWQMLNNEKYKDLLSIDTMSDYFQKYFMEREKELDYRVYDLDVETSLIDLLSVNRNRWLMKNDKFSICAQAFKTAGREFSMIEDNTTAVLVPYNDEAKELLSVLYSEPDDYETMKILRRSQKYAVGLYDHTISALREESALDYLPCGIIVLKEEYYDSQLGVVLQGKSMDLLVF